MSITHILILMTFICLGGLGLATLQSAFLTLYRCSKGNIKRRPKALKLKHKTAVYAARKQELFQ